MPAAVTLRDVTSQNLHDVLKLRVTLAQEQFVASNAVSLAEAHFEPRAWYRAIYAGETPVGFVMLYEDQQKPRYYLWRYMIDARYQGHGYGRQALERVIERVRALPQAQEMFLSYVPAAGSPQPFYEKLGFVDTGEVHDGENVMRLALPAPESSELPAAATPTEPAPTAASLTHVVLFKLKDNTPQAVTAAGDKLRSLQGKVPALQSLEVGQDIVRSPRSYDLALIARFASLADMQAYQVHPYHQEVLAYIQTASAAVVAVDFEPSAGTN